MAADETLCLELDQLTNNNQNIRISVQKCCLLSVKRKPIDQYICVLGPEECGAVRDSVPLR